MIFTFVLLDIIYSLIFKLSLNSIFYILLIGNKCTKISFVLITTILDIYFNKIFLLPVVIILLLIGKIFAKLKNTLQQSIFLVIYFLLIFLYLNNISPIIILSIFINLCLYIFIMKGKELNIN